jgi:glycosyltransferase involved in cell wall biosynthesis
MNKKKICFIVSSPLTAKAFLLEHFKVLSSTFDVYLIANFENEEQENISPFLKGTFDVKIYREINILNDLKAVKSLTKVLKRESFDAVHSVTPKAGLIGMISGKLSHVKLRTHVFTGQVWHTKRGLPKLMLMAIDRLIVSLTTNVLVDGESQRQYLIAHHIVRERNSQVLGKGSISGVDVNRFLPDENMRKQYRNELQYEDQDVVFLFLGRLKMDKGVLDLAHAFSKLQNEANHVKLLIIGFDEENLVPQIIDILGDINFKFYGSTNHPELVLQVGDVLCLPSYREGFGTTVIEGALLTLPVICSDTYGLKETIIDDVSGIRHPVKDIEAIYHAMKKLASNPIQRKKMGEAGRKYVLENFKAAEISQKWLDYYIQELK